MRKLKLYEIIKTLPKGVLHNVFFDTCEDRNFVVVPLFSTDKLLPNIPMSTSLKILLPLELVPRKKQMDMDGSRWNLPENVTKMRMILLRLCLEFLLSLMNRNWIISRRINLKSGALLRKKSPTLELLFTLGIYSSNM